MPKYSLSILLSTTLLCGDNFFNTSSFQGYSGVINTPTAYVIEDKKIEFQFSNQVDTPKAKIRDDFKAQQYFVNIGFLKNLELTGRLNNITYKDSKKFLIRDLSASFKYQLPIYHKYLPTIGFGIQDLGGAASNYEAKYIVATKEYQFIRGSIGYGFDSLRLDGVFGSVELKANDWFYILFEHDSKEKQLGVRLNTPENFFRFADLSAIAKVDGSERFSFALNVRVNLGIKHHSKELYTQGNSISYIPQTDNKKNRVELLKDALIELGVENIDIADRDQTIYVAYENNIFNQNEIDALGAVLGYLFKLNFTNLQFEIVIKKSNLKVKRVSGDLNSYKEFIKNLSEKSKREFIDTLTVDSNFSHICRGCKDVDSANSSYLKSRVELGVGARTFVGTEVGVFDYLISIRPYIYWNLYRGLDFGIEYDLPLLRSENFKDGKVFSFYDQGATFKSASLNYSIIYKSFINVTTLGVFNNQIGGYNSSYYNFKEHTLKLKLGYLKDRETKEARESFLAGYQYYYSPLNLIVGLNSGEYYYGDRGYDIELKRYFGDTLLKLFYQNSSSEYMGIGFELPLNPRYIKNSPYIQLSGAKDFSYQLRSVVFDENSRNDLKPDGAVKPKHRWEINSRFLNRDRLNEPYIKREILRVRDAYFSFVK